MNKFCVAAVSFIFIWNAASFIVNAEIVKPQDPYGYNELIADLTELEQKYGQLIRSVQIGESHFGREIWAVQLGKGKEHILLTGGHHGREWITSNLLMMMLERYAKEYSRKELLGFYDTKILDEVSIWFIPMVNPDGVEIQQGKILPDHKDILIKMNDGDPDFKRWKANGIGIDLNRQYPAGWEEVPSPEAPSHKFYKGTRPLEAKEVQTLVRFVAKHVPLASIAYHSSGQEIFWQYGDKQNVFRDYVLAAKISLLTGYPLAIPPKEAVGSGFTDWFINTYERPAFTLELCDFHGEQNPPIELLEEEWERNQFIGLMLAEEMSNLR